MATADSASSIRMQIRSNAALLFGEDTNTYCAIIMEQNPTDGSGIPGYGAIITRGFDLWGGLLAQTKPVSASAEAALGALLDMLADGLFVKYSGKSALWRMDMTGRKWVVHGIGEYLGDSLSKLAEGDRQA